MAKDTDFGLINDPSFTIDQSEAFKKFLAEPTPHYFTPGNSYWIPKVANFIFANPVEIKSLTGSGLTTLKGSAIFDQTTKRWQGGNRLFWASSSLKISNVRFLNFSQIISGYATVTLDEIRIENCTIKECDGFIGAPAIKTKSLIINDNTFEDLTSHVVLMGSGSMITGSQEFCRNNLRNIQRYVYRTEAGCDAPLIFEGNVIDDLHARSYVGTSACARVIQRGSHTFNFIRRNKITNVKENGGNANLIYWTGGDVSVTGNEFGSFIDGAANGGFFIDQKSTECGAAIVVGNHFYDSGLGPINCPIVKRLTSARKDTPETIISDNEFEVLGAPIFFAFNNSFAHDDFKPANAHIGSNIVNDLQSDCFVHILQGANEVSVVRNKIYEFRNPKERVWSTNDRRKSLVRVELTANVPLSAKNIFVAENEVEFSNFGEARSIEGALIGLNVFNNLLSKIEVKFVHNKVQGATSWVLARNTVGSFDVQGQSNTSIRTDILETVRGVNGTIVKLNGVYKIEGTMKQ